MALPWYLTLFVDTVYPSETQESISKRLQDVIRTHKDRIKLTTWAKYLSQVKMELIRTHIITNPGFPSSVMEWVHAHENIDSRYRDISKELRAIPFHDPIRMYHKWRWITWKVKSDQELKVICKDLTDIPFFRHGARTFDLSADLVETGGKKKVNDCNNARKTLTPPISIPNLEWFKECTLNMLYSDEQGALLTALLLACGRRTSSVYLPTCEFRKVDAYHVEYNEVLKKRKSTAPYIIPILCTADLFLEALQRFRDIVAVKCPVNLPIDVHRHYGRYNKQEVREYTSLFIRDATPRMLRSIYAVLCTLLPEFIKTNPTETIRQVLTHSSTTSSVCYHKVHYNFIIDPIFQGERKLAISEPVPILTDQPGQPIMNSAVVGFEIDQDQYPTVDNMVLVLERNGLQGIIDKKKFHPRIRSNSLFLTGEPFHPVWHWCSSLAGWDMVKISRPETGVALLLSSGNQVSSIEWPPKTKRTLLKEERIAKKEEERRQKRLEKLVSGKTRSPSTTTPTSKKRKAKEDTVTPGGPESASQKDANVSSESPFIEV
jgi:Telomere resolvase